VSAKAIKEQEQEEARKSLRKLLKPGQTVYCVLRRRSSSGMSRIIDLLIAYPEIRDVYPKLPDGRTDWEAKPKRKRVGYAIRSIGYTAAKAMGDRWDNDAGGIRVSGCGMDMGFATVYSLGHAVWPKGTRKPHSTRNGEPDRDGGYALKHSWL
jgi:hypothetical protein